MLESLQSAVDLVASNRFVAAGLLTAIALLASWVVDVVITRVARQLTRRTASTFDDRVFQFLHNPIRTTVFLVGLGLAFVHLDLGHTQTLVGLAGLKLVALFVWTLFTLRFVGIAVTSMARAKSVGFVVPRTEPLWTNVARIVILAGAIYGLLLIVGVQPTAWLASAGVVGLALGFAAQDTLANLVAGISILADAPYKIGDTINLEGGDRGRVTHIGLRSTRLMRRDDVEITLPNSIIASAKVLNESGGPSRKHRIAIAVGVSYGSDIDLVERVLLDVASSNPRVVPDPEARVRFRQFGDSSLDYELLVWIADPQERGIATHELNRAVYLRFAEEGVQIPFPQRDLWIKQMPRGD